MLFRIDKQEAFYATLLASDNYTTLGLWRGNKSIPFILELMEGEVLLMRYRNIIYKFILTGLKESIGPIREICNWTDEALQKTREKRVTTRNQLLEDIASLLDETLVQEPSSADTRVLNASDRSRLELLFNSQIRKCWFLSPELENSGHTVRMRIWLREDGSLARRPEILAGNSKLRQDRRYQSMVDSARRAILNCAPFEIPEELYIPEFIFNFETGPY